MNKYNKITALYSRLSVGDEDRDGGESNSIQNQKRFLEEYAKQQQLVNVKHYIDDDESGRFFDRSGYVRMMEDVEGGKVGVCVMKDMTRWGRDYLQVGNAMETFRRNGVRFIAINNSIDSMNPESLEMAPFINIMSEWYAKDISKKVKTGIRTKGISGKPVVTEALYGYVKDPGNKDFWLVDSEAAAVIRLIYSLFMDGKNRNQICIHLKEKQIPTPTFYLKDRGRGTAKGKALNEANRYSWNKVTVTRILTRQEYCGDVVNFKTAKHYRDKRSGYVDKSEWHITENVHEPIIDRAVFENAARILETAPVRRPNGDGYTHPLSGLLFCADCGSKLHIRTIRGANGIRYMARCGEYAKGKAKGAVCGTPHQIDCDALLNNTTSLLSKIAKYSLENKEAFESMVKNSLASRVTDDLKKQQKRVPQLTARIEQINTVINKLYEDNALGNIDEDRYRQLSQKYSEEYYALRSELEAAQAAVLGQTDTAARAKKFIALMESYIDFDEITTSVINEFISKLVVHERDVKGGLFVVQHIDVYFNYIGKFENELTETAEPSQEEQERMRAEIEEMKKEKSREYHRNYRKEYRAKNLEKRREYERVKGREYRERKKLQGDLTEQA